MKRPGKIQILIAAFALAFVLAIAWAAHSAIEVRRVERLLDRLIFASSRQDADAIAVRLSAHKSRAAVSRMLWAYGHTKGDIESLRIADVIVSIGEPAVPQLLDSMRKPSDLGNLPGPFASLFRSKRPINEPAVNRLLLRIGKPAVPALINALGSQDASLLYQVVTLLGDIGDRRATEPLVKMLSRKDGNDAVFVALGKLRDPRALPGLEAFLKENSSCPAKCRCAIATIDRIGGPDALALLETASANPDPTVRALAALKIAQARQDRAADYYAMALSTPNWYVRLDAARGLASTKDPRAAAALIALFGEVVDDASGIPKNERQYLARAALLSLESIGTPEARAYVDAALVKGLPPGTPPGKRDLAAIAANYASLTGTANAAGGESDTVLILALERHGDLAMAAALRNSGSDVLSRAALDWARRHGLMDDLEKAVGAKSADTTKPTGNLTLP